MKRIPESQIPILSTNGIIEGESVAFGVGEPGIIVQYMERNDCILIEWTDVIAFGVELLKANPVKKVEDAVEIEKPTVVE